MDKSAQIGHLGMFIATKEENVCHKMPPGSTPQEMTDVRVLASDSEIGKETILNQSGEIKRHLAQACLKFEMEEAGWVFSGISLSIASWNLWLHLRRRRPMGITKGFLVQRNPIGLVVSRIKCGHAEGSVGFDGF